MSATILASDLCRFNSVLCRWTRSVSGTVTADEIVLVMSDSTRETWTRAPRD